MPGIEARAPERTETSSGLAGRRSACRPACSTWRRCRGDLGAQRRRVAPPVRVEVGAHFGGDGEARRHRQAEAGHLGEVGALAAEQILHRGVAVGACRRRRRRRTGRLFAAAVVVRLLRRWRPCARWGGAPGAPSSDWSVLPCGSSSRWKVHSAVRLLRVGLRVGVSDARWMRRAPMQPAAQHQSRPGRRQPLLQLVRPIDRSAGGPAASSRARAG